MSKMLTRERHTRWKDLIFQAECADKMGASNITVDIDLLLAMDVYLEKLNENLLDGITVVGFGCKSEPYMPEDVYRPDLDEMPQEVFAEAYQTTCDHCGLPILGGDPVAKTGHGTLHVHCHGPATRRLGNRHGCG